MTDSLEKELSKYHELLPGLVGQHEGEFALVCGTELIGVYQSYQDALKIGYEKCGIKPFLVKKISAIEQVSFFTRDIQQSCHI